jgi:hypothetical protein
MEVGFRRIHSPASHTGTTTCIVCPAAGIALRTTPACVPGATASHHHTTTAHHHGATAGIAIPTKNISCIRSIKCLRTGRKISNFESHIGEL